MCVLSLFPVLVLTIACASPPAKFKVGLLRQLQEEPSMAPMAQADVPLV